MNEHTKFPFDLVAIDPASATPIARQLYASFRSSILGGRLPAGCALPPTRALAKELGIGRNTVIAAYEQLLAEGYLLSRAGSGTWVAPLNGHLVACRATPERELFLSKRGELIASHPQPPRVHGRINLQPGFADKASFPFATWARLLARNARRRTDDNLGYSDFAGHQRLRETISEYIGVAPGARGRPVPALRGISGSDRVIYVGSFGKTIFSALRIGFLVVPRVLADRFSRAISVTGQFAPLLLQLALADFIAQGHFARHLKRTRR